MKTLTKIMMSAAILTAALTSCSELPEYEGLNPEGTPVKFVLSGDRVFDGAKANIKVTSDVPVPQDVTIKLSLDAEATVKAENVTFPNLVIKQGETEGKGSNSLLTSLHVPIKIQWKKLRRPSEQAPSRLYVPIKIR